MKRIKNMIIAAAAVSLMLVAGCYDGGVTQPLVDGYEGFMTKGWNAFENGDYSTAMDYFEAAIEMDVTRPDAFVGAGWCSILLPDFWLTGDQFDYMAVQLDGGTWPVVLNTVTIPQTLDWSEFVCIDPVLTANDIQVINAWGDTILVVEGDTLFWGGNTGPDSLKGSLDNLEIGDWFYDQYEDVSFKYTFEIDNPNVLALFTVANGFSSTQVNSVDSIVNGSSVSTVYLNVPLRTVPAVGDNYRTWCMFENNMTFEYATYESAAGQTSFSTDGVAAYGILQDARGVNGDVHFGVATLLGLAGEGEYSFSHYTGITTLNLKGMAAAMAYRNTYFRPAFDICRDAGYALDIEVSDPNFLVELMHAIEMMLL